MNTSDFVKRAIERIISNLNVLGQNSVDRIKQSISSPSPPVSNPGSPPNSVTGDLVGSVGHRVFEDGSEVVLRVYSDSDHAAYMEYGTETVEARPFLAVDIPNLKKEAKSVLGK